jgi:hypothetical protein
METEVISTPMAVASYTHTGPCVVSINGAYFCALSVSLDMQNKRAECVVEADETHSFDFDSLEAIEREQNVTVYRLTIKGLERTRKAAQGFRITFFSYDMPLFTNTAPGIHP